MRRKVHYQNPNAVELLSKYITQQIKKYNTQDRELLIVCIGTDRSTGDSLGPLVGSYLNTSAEVFGSIEKPVHANVLQENIDRIKREYVDPFIIAIDAGLSRKSNVGYICVDNGSIKPGAGVDKVLPEIGDISIVGFVNIGGYMEYLVLQSTRLSLVMSMAKIIADSLEIATLNYKEAASINMEV